MVPKTSIEWSDVSWNPTAGCTKVSAGCDIGYARRLATVRLSMHYRAKEPVVEDLFHAHIPEEFLRDIFKAMLEADEHMYQVLTKRPSRAARFYRADAPSRAGSGTSSRARSIGSGREGENE